MKIGFVGFGKMAEAIVLSLVKNKIQASQLFVSDKNSDRQALAKELSLNVLETNKEVSDSCEITFLCVKPQDMKEVLEELSDNGIFLSIAAGIKLSSLQKKLEKAARIMPNAPLMVNEGMSAIVFSENFSQEEKDQVKGLLECSGKVIELDEKKFDAVTALSGSGPAFFALFISQLAKAAQEQGLSEKEALLLAEQTCLGTAKLLIEKNMTPEELISMVASKGGTTEAGLKVLDSPEFKEIVIETVKKAAQKSKELGEE